MTPRPWTLVAELTYACPLRCVYCSNPVARSATAASLALADWQRLLLEAEALGVMQVHFSGGEPLLFRELDQLVAHARALDLYTTLVTSGVPAQPERFVSLARAGLDHVQLSLQSLEPGRARRLCGVDRLQQKLAAARWIKDAGLELTLNVVLSRDNIDELPEFVELARSVGAMRLELANAQYLGWALVNRAQLLPTREQLDRARERAFAARERLRGELDVVFVLPDYYADQPRACMDGWANRYLIVTPDGLLLPCHAAHAIEGMSFDDVRSAPLATLWKSSPGLERYRGQQWLPEPCRDCDARSRDFGGCRCQAYQLTGDASVADPACRLAPAHGLIRRAREAAALPATASLRYRRAPEVTRRRRVGPAC